MSKINTLMIKRYSKFVGMLDREKVKQAYVDADIFLLLSYSENYGITIIESIASGCPVTISKNVNIHKEIMDYALRKHDWENPINKFSDVYKEILVDKKR